MLWCAIVFILLFYESKGTLVFILSSSLKPIFYKENRIKFYVDLLHSKHQFMFSCYSHNSIDCHLVLKNHECFSTPAGDHEYMSAPAGDR